MKRDSESKDSGEEKREKWMHKKDVEPRKNTRNEMISRKQEVKNETKKENYDKTNTR